MRKFAIAFTACAAFSLTLPLATPVKAETLVIKSGDRDRDHDHHTVAIVLKHRDCCDHD